jgi:hypothetical protein
MKFVKFVVLALAVVAATLPEVSFAHGHRRRCCGCCSSCSSCGSGGCESK